MFGWSLSPKFKPYHNISYHVYSYVYIHTCIMYVYTYIFVFSLKVSIDIYWHYMAIYIYIYICFSYTFFFLNVIFHIFLSSARRWRIDKKPTSISEDVCIIARGWPLPTMPCTCERPSMGWSVQNIGFTTIEKPMRILKNKVVLWVDLVWNIKLIMEWIIYIIIF